MPFIPLLLLFGGGLGGFVFGKGLTATGEIVKYSVIGGIAWLVARQLGVIK